MSTLISNEDKAGKLARDVLLLSRNTLLVNLRFLDMALSRFRYLPFREVMTYGTDGSYLLYDPVALLRRYKEEKEEVTRGYLHIVFHCVFRHMFINTLVDRTYWDLATDISVEAIINELDIRSTATARSRKQESVIAGIKAGAGFLTAEKIYNHFLNDPPKEKELAEMQELFTQDDHFAWYLTEE